MERFVKYESDASSADMEQLEEKILTCSNHESSKHVSIKAGYTSSIKGSWSTRQLAPTVIGRNAAEV